jgi:hypothetical protein
MGSVTARLARVKRMIARVKRRLAELEALQRDLETNPMWRLCTACSEAQLAGNDPLADDETRLRERIVVARARLDELQRPQPTDPDMEGAPR